MKAIIQLAIVSIILLAGCKKTDLQENSPAVSPTFDAKIDTKSTMSTSPNGNSGIILIYYDGNKFQMNLKPFTDQPASSLLAHNKSINILYESTGFITVTNAIEGGGPGYNALWQEVDIVFNNGFTPHQFLSDNDILPAAAGPNPEIKLFPTTEIYRCDILQHTKIQ
jgi:hypothetical protein